MKHPLQRRTPLGLTVLGACLLTGCTAPLLPDMNTGLSGVHDRLRGIAGTPSATAAAAAPDVCDRAAYEAGFKTQYVRHWNWAIHDKEILYQVKSRQHPEDAAARTNYALYRGKQLSGQATGYEAGDYGLQLDPNGHIRNDCQARSYTQGETAGMRAAGRDIQALAAQEV